ncbi:MAG TPA: hypothetical protein VGR84_12300 [Candidatus Acidoferrales bacterium]|nr:hypothetical protein [Candidatus Acidoferrales bacterium]
MKRTSRVVVLAGLAILVIAMLHLPNPLLADGGAPMPPWPPSNSLLADGGAPMPPWPPSNPLLADGGAPMPPWPQAADFLTVDVGALRTAAVPEHSGTPRA